MISVLMPVYNCEQYLKFSIKSILEQTFTDFEFLIINDGSDDKSEDVILSFNDARIKYIRRPHEGLSASLNYGLTNAKYRIIARMDADDISLPHRLSTQIHVMGQYDFVSSWYLAFARNKLQYVVKLPVVHEDIKKRLALHSVISHPSVMFKKDIVMSLGGYDESSLIEDYDLWCRAINKYKFHNIPQYLLLYRIHKSSISGDKNKLKDGTYNLQKLYYMNVAEIFGINSINEKNVTLGWREFFYGDKEKARIYWNGLKLKTPKLLVAYTLTFLPKYFLDFVNNFKSFLRISLFFNLFRKEIKDANRYLASINKSIP